MLVDLKFTELLCFKITKNIKGWFKSSFIGMFNYVIFKSCLFNSVYPSCGIQRICFDIRVQVDREYSMPFLNEPDFSMYL